MTKKPIFTEEMVPSLNRTNYSTDEEEFSEELDAGFIEPKSIIIIITPSKRKRL